MGATKIYDYFPKFLRGLEMRVEMLYGHVTLMHGNYTKQEVEMVLKTRKLLVKILQGRLMPFF